MSAPLKRFILVITLIRVVMNTAFRFVYPFLPVLARGLGVGLQPLAQAVSLRSFAGAAGPFLATVADTRGRRFGMLFGLGLFTIGLLLVVVWPSFPALVAALLLTAFGKAVFDPSVLAYLGDQIPYERRGQAIGLTEFGWSLSFILGVPAAGLLIAWGGWSAPFPLLALLAVLGLLVLSRIIPAGGGEARARGRAWASLQAVLGAPAAITALGMGVLISAANEMVNLVFGVWMEASFGLQIAALGSASLVIGLAELGGESLVSSLTDRLGKLRSVAAGILLNCVTALALPVVGVSSAGALVGLFFFYLTFEFTLVSFIPFITEVLPSVRATLLATNAAGLMLGRAMAALAASPLYLAGGISSNALAVVALNLSAVAMLGIFRRLETPQELKG